jgi:sortase A
MPAGRAVAPVLLLAGLVLLASGGWIHAKARLAQVLIARSWSAAAPDERCPVPWPWADTWPVARLRAPDHGVDLVVLAGGSGRTMAFGPGHLDATAEPGGDGNCVVAGHRDTHFAFLRNLRVGDRLDLEDRAGRHRRFRVAATAVVERTETWVAAPTAGAALTLVTCYPFDTPIPGGPLRYVVRADAEG